MAIQQYRTTKFRRDSLAKIENMVEIVDEYQQQGLRLTARQLYYQFVSRDLCPNTPAEYKKLTALLTDARYAGLIDWDAIEDRGREPVTVSQWDNIGGVVESALAAYRLPRWKGQSHYAELWVEKQALAGVLAPLAREHHVTLMVNKGYSSASAMKESAERISSALDKMEDEGKAEEEYTGEEFEKGTPIIFYLGDHDPSGEDMVRDISVRLTEFGVYDLDVQKIALTIEQVKQYNPPPNPAKISDPRAGAYIQKFGEHSWEVDALPPEVLTRLIRRAFASVLDTKKMEAIKKQEETDKKKLRAAVVDIMGE